MSVTPAGSRQAGRWLHSDRRPARSWGARPGGSGVYGFSPSVRTRHTVPVCRVSDATFFPASATLVDDLPTAEDVVQDAFTALFRRHGGTLAGLADPEADLRTSVVNGARARSCAGAEPPAHTRRRTR